jgi:cation diffusion facilitator family transporter
MTAPAFRYPPELREVRDRARRYAWRSVCLISIAGVVVYLATGHSQIMKTAWATDFLSTIPSFGLLIALRYELRPPTERYPYGHFRALSICFLLTSTVLLTMGVWLFSEALLKLAHRERPPIGGVALFGQVIWAGWTMIGALALSMVVGMYAGRIKQPIAAKLQSKAIEAESATNRNEWMSEGAGILGILLVGLGWWWADALAAAIISVQIVREGWLNLRQVIGDLMDEAPSRLGTHDLEDLPVRLQRALEGMDWVREAAVRLREHGHVITGDVLVVPRDESNLVARIHSASGELKRLDWRLHAITIMPVSHIDRRQPAA